MMNDIAFEIALHSRTPEAISWFDDVLAPLLGKSDQWSDLMLFRPIEGEARDPHNDDGAPWPRLAMLIFADAAAWSAFARSEPLLAALRSRGDAIKLTGNAFEQLVYEIGDGTRPSRSKAGFSYVVRYSGSEADTVEFRKDYLENHHIGLAQLPGIRCLMNFVPLRDQLLPTLANAPYVIGNEVQFDDLAAFNAAMASPQRQLVREIFLRGPKAPPAVHFPMTRVVVGAR
jgi:hypothetical protein